MSDQDKAKAYGVFAGNALAPALVSPYNVEKLYNAAQGNVDSKGRQYDIKDALLQVFGGVKNVPINTDEMFRQRMGKISIDQRNIQDMMKLTARDQSMSTEQKRAKLLEYVGQLKELQKDARDVQGAYQREKKRGAN
jgi:hypothetical protein